MRVLQMLRKIFVFFIFCLLVFNVSGSNKKAYKLKYSFYTNDKKIDNAERTLTYLDGVTYLSNDSDKVRNYIDFNAKAMVSILSYNSDLYKVTTAFDSLAQPQFKETSDVILDYDCKYATFSSFSNTIEVWYTTEAQAKGSPYKSFLPEKDALVLKVRINNSYMYQIESIDKVKLSKIPDYPVAAAMEVKQSRMEELMIRSRYVTIPVFEDEIINFDPSKPTAKNPVLVKDSVYHFSNGSVILKRITLPEVWHKGAKVFVQLTCASNGDAYDRVGSVFMIKDNLKAQTMLDAFTKGVDVVPSFTDNDGQKYQGMISESGYETPVELMRFASSFGVGHFNKRREINNYPWFDEALYKEEITQVIPKNQNEITIGVFVGNYDKGGHKVNLKLDFYPDEDESNSEKQIVKPLFYTVNIMEMSGQNYGRFFNNDTLTVRFNLDNDLKASQLIYTSTGHGGWGGGDEFNPKLNQILLDGKLVYTVTPWRTDCATYRLYNPASGNFSNGMSSSDLSRSNWCPASVTLPYIIHLEKLTKGKHEVKVIIDQGDQEGNSFSHWCVSGTLTGEE
nr:PNGase F N-terminal domain-containing protein [uncultured Carboxylicivirga sp.]